MTRRIDVLRSWLRTAAQGAGRGLKRIVPTEGLRQLAADLRRKRVSIPTARIGTALAHAPEVRSAAVLARGGKLLVDAVFSDGEALQVSFAPAAVRFAPRGAKELVFRVEPAERAAQLRVAGLASTLAGALAHELYRAGLPNADPDDPSGAIVDREGADRLRIDLRTVPAVRSALGSTALAVMMEVMKIAAVYVDDHGVRIELELPQFPT